MNFFISFTEYLIIFKLVKNIISITIGAGLCFGALKWRRGLLTTTAIGWGLVLGIILGTVMGEMIGDVFLIICMILGLIIMPILTYTVPGVNRFMLGFLVGSKLFFMLTTVLMKSGDMDIATAIVSPLIVGAIVGVVLMAWMRMRASAIILAGTFIGASGIAPAIADTYNCVMFALTGDASMLFDIYDLIFSIFKVELTDGVTLVLMIALMLWGCKKQFDDLRNRGIPLDTPVIGFEEP